MAFISHKEMFPELNNDNKNRFIEFLTQKDFKTFMYKALEIAQYELTDKDLQLCEIISDMLIRKGVLYPYQRLESTDVILMAAMLRNSYINEACPVTSLFMAREEFSKLNKLEEFEYGIPGQFFEQLFQLIEGQFGEETPVQFCKPSVGSVQELFANCIYIQECLGRYDNLWK